MKNIYIPSNTKQDDMAANTFVLFGLLAIFLCVLSSTANAQQCKQKSCKTKPSQPKVGLKRSQPPLPRSIVGFWQQSSFLFLNIAQNSYLYVDVMCPPRTSATACACRTGSVVVNEFHPIKDLGNGNFGGCRCWYYNPLNSDSKTYFEAWAFCHY